MNSIVKKSIIVAIAVQPLWASPVNFYENSSGYYFEGESVEISIPTVEMRPLNYTPLSISSTCGGISRHLGGLSFINASKMREMINAIAGNIPAVALKIAIDEFEPVFGKNIDRFNDLMLVASGTKINSCEMAQKILDDVDFRHKVQNAREATEKFLNLKDNTNDDVNEYDAPEKLKDKENVCILLAGLDKSDFTHLEKVILLGLLGSSLSNGAEIISKYESILGLTGTNENVSAIIDKITADLPDKQKNAVIASIKKNDSINTGKDGVLDHNSSINEEKSIADTSNLDNIVGQSQVPITFFLNPETLKESLNIYWRLLLKEKLNGKPERLSDTTFNVFEKMCLSGTESVILYLNHAAAAHMGANDIKIDDLVKTYKSLYLENLIYRFLATTIKFENGLEDGQFTQFYDSINKSTLQASTVLHKIADSRKNLALRERIQHLREVIEAKTARQVYATYGGGL